MIVRAVAEPAGAAGSIDERVASRLSLVPVSRARMPKRPEFASRRREKQREMHACG